MVAVERFYHSATPVMVPVLSPEVKLMVRLKGRERPERAAAERSKPSQVEVEAEGMMGAEVSICLPAPSEIRREQVPEERYWSILTRMVSWSPLKRTVVREPVMAEFWLGSAPSYCVGVLPSVEVEGSDEEVEGASVELGLVVVELEEVEVWVVEGAGGGVGVVFAKCLTAKMIPVARITSKKT